MKLKPQKVACVTAASPEKKSDFFSGEAAVTQATQKEDYYMALSHKDWELPNSRI